MCAEGNRYDGSRPMYLSGLIHRDRLFDVASRWLADRVNNDDGRVLTEIFAFERAITSPLVRALVADLARTIRPGDLRLTRVNSKDAVRKAIVDAVHDPTPRVEQLLTHYREFPEEFFPRSDQYLKSFLKYSFSRNNPAVFRQGVLDWCPVRIPEVFNTHPVRNTPIRICKCIG